jgi:hypothetical protein
MINLLDSCPVLKEMLDPGIARGQAGDAIPIHSNIPGYYAEALFRTVLEARPSIVIEVGMAFGVSSLAILAALHRAGDAGRLISIDPFQSTQWGGCGITAIEQAGFRERHELVQDFDYNALPRLLASGQRLDFAYIDGWNTFDYKLFDWWYVDKMLKVEGVVGFRGCGYPSVDKVIRFVRSHRKYDELDVGLPLEVANYSRRRGLLRRLTGKDPRAYYMQRQDRFFIKRQVWEPSWDFYAEF